MSSYSITYSAELMQNYLQTDILAPEKKFQALQTEDGTSLLFSIGTDHALYVTKEVPAARSGWERSDVSSAQIRKDFPSQSGATCKDFASAQSNFAAQASIHLAMVLSDQQNDHLYLSLGNSDADTAWTAAPAWVAYPFDDPAHHPAQVKIVGVLISEATDAEYIVVDVIRDPSSAEALIFRYYIDVNKTDGYAWHPHDLSIDLEAGKYSSCLGRRAGQEYVDGLYTIGQVAGAAQFTYQPLYNAFNPKVPASPSLYSLPDGKIPEAITACWNPDNTSDLYVAAEENLYWFASTNQKNGATGVLVATSPLLAAVRSLYAYTADGSITVWGLNSNDQVFYLSCPLDRQQTLSAWNVPLPILSGVDAISPFIDRGYNANTFFAHTGTDLIKLVKSPTTGLWDHRPITLAPSTTTTPATPIHTYTTHIQVTDAAGRGAGNVSVTLSATNVTSVYINHLYYIIGPSPIELTTDILGTITIVELTSTLAATRFHVSVASEPAISVNTMDTAWQRNSQYTTVASLQSAKIVNRDGSTRDFIPAGTSPQDLQSVANANQNLAKAYTSLSSAPPPTPGLRLQAPPAPATLTAAGISEGIPVDVGDLFSWLKSGVDAVVKLIQDAASDFWHFVVTIGDAVYHGILDCVETVVAAATWVYHAIKISIEDIIKFLEFLFGWQDILVTHKVLKNLFLCLGRSTVDGIEATKAQVADVFQELQSQINSWADIPDFNQTAQATLGATKPVAGQNSAPANLGVHHFQGGAAASSSSLSPLGPAEAILNDLITLLEAEGDTLASAAKAIKTDIIDQFTNLSITEIISRFVAIVADTVLQSAENVFVTVLDVFAQLVQGIIDLLSAKLDIPVLSWLYTELTGEDLSFLDVICLVAAIPVTVIYKAATQTVPFAETDPFTQGLIGATSLAEIRALFVVSTSRAVDSAPLAMTMFAAADASEISSDTDVLDQARLKTFGFVTGIGSFAGAAVLVVVTNIQRTINLLPPPLNTVYPKTLATIACVGNIAYVLPNIATFINARTDNWYANLNNAVTGVSILKGIAAIPAATFTNPLVGKSFAFVETFINLIWNVPVITNIVVNKDKWNTTYKSLIPESIGNFAFNLGGILEFPIAQVDIEKNIEAKIVLVLLQAGFMVSYGVFMIIAGSIYQFADNQEH